MAPVDLKQSVVSMCLENYSKVWLSSQVDSNGAAIHDGMLAWVQNDGGYYEPFPVTN